jgi:hypothetical protein
VCTHFPLLRSSKEYEHNHKTSSTSPYFIIIGFSVEMRDERHGNLIS